MMDSLSKAIVTTDDNQIISSHSSNCGTLDNLTHTMPNDDNVIHSTSGDASVMNTPLATIHPNDIPFGEDNVLHSTSGDSFGTPLETIPPERIPFCEDKTLIPVVGMLFSTLENGIEFYRKYAHTCGFMIRLEGQKSVDGHILYKRVVCNRQGEGQAVGEKRRREVTRVNCGAAINFKRLADGQYKVLWFHESHSHILASPDTMLHLKGKRKLNSFHKKMMVDNSKINLGPVKTFRMLKEYCQGYSNVGASLEDFKNFSRNVKKYIKEYDAQMIIECFSRKKAICESFYFDFDKDDEGHLTRLFWADPISIKNYKLFGPSVSFDTTFGKNQYRLVFAPFTGVDNNKRCITFAAGLVAKETIESFAWLFDNFVKAMGGSYPDCIITDQDPGIKGGVEKVFGDKTLHRLCIWHIMKKMNDKVGSSKCRETDFLTDINECVWGEDISPSEFEEKWPSVVSKHHLDGNEWLKQIYDLRKSWIPAYFRDFPLNGIMRTTSRSESVNSFFSNFTNPHLSLVEFYMRFESAMDAQRWKESQLKAEAKTSSPRLLTPLPLEVHASEFYTPTVFYEFQEELKTACFNCGFERSNKAENIEHIDIVDHEKSRVYTVDVIDGLDELILSCSCKRFEGYGVLCSHVLYVLKDRGIKKVPGSYLMNRWSKSVTCSHAVNIDETLTRDCSSFSSRKNKIGELWSEIYTCMSLVEDDEKHSDELLDLIRGFKEKMILQSGSGSKTKSKNDEIGDLIGSKIPSELNILPPNKSKNKGSGKRILSEKEKAVKEKDKQLRKCAGCKQMAPHDLRNCPVAEAARKAAALAEAAFAEAGLETSNEVHMESGSPSATSSEVHMESGTPSTDLRSQPADEEVDTRITRNRAAKTKTKSSSNAISRVTKCAESTVEGRVTRQSVRHQKN